MCVLKLNLLRESSVSLQTADQLLRVRRRRPEEPLPRGGAAICVEHRQDPALHDGPGGAHHPPAYDRVGQEVVLQDLGLWDSPRVAVGERQPLRSAHARVESHRIIIATTAMRRIYGGGIAGWWLIFLVQRHEWAIVTRRQPRVYL